MDKGTPVCFWCTSFHFCKNRLEAEINARLRRQVESVLSFWGFCNFLKLDRKWFRPLGSVPNRKWRRNSTLRPRLCANHWLILANSYLFPFKSYSAFLFWLQRNLWVQTLGFLGDSTPLNISAHQRDPEKAPPCVKPIRLSHREGCATLGLSVMWTWEKSIYHVITAVRNV